MKQGYKKTDIGFIPEDWNIATLGSLSRVIRGASPRPKGDKRFYGGNIPRLMVEDVTRDKKFVTPQVDFLTIEGAKQSRPCKKGTLTIVCSGTPKVVGMPSILAVDACIHDGMIALVDLSPKMVSDYLYHQLNSFQEELFKSATHGGTFVNLTTKGIGAFQVNLPPTNAEQQAIATALSDIDALIDGLSKLITKKRDIKKATMQQLLTGKTRLPGFSGEWKIKPLEELCSLKSGEGITAERIDNHSVFPCYGGNGLRGYTTTYTHEGNYALIGRQGALCGNVISVSGQFFASEHALVVTPSHNTNIVWLTFVLGRMNLNQYSESSAQPGLSATKLLILDVNCPPTKEEQSTIDQILSDMYNEIDALEKRLEKTRMLKQGMMQELLTGRIRLV
jgi:type I restriction enzyme S subunit